MGYLNVENLAENLILNKRLAQDDDDDYSAALRLAQNTLSKSQKAKKKKQKTDYQSELLMVRTRQATDSNPGEARAPDWMPLAGLLPR